MMLSNGKVAKYPKKLTDNEIVKALECCIKPTSDCDNCPAHNVVDDENCFDVVKQGALNLINRQKAKLDEAEDTIQFADKELKKAEAEIERLQKLLYAFLDTRNGDLVHITQKELEVIQKPIKSEAIKGFAKRLEKEFAQMQREYRNVLNSDGACAMIMAINATNIILKEKIGE